MKITTSGDVWMVDTEWGFCDDRVDQESAWVPVVLCVVGRRTGRRLSFWAKDARLRTFFRQHADDVFVAHYSVAEMKYLLRHGVRLPARWFDTFVGWRYVTNRPGNLEAGLTAALLRLGLPGLASWARSKMPTRCWQR